MRSAAQMSPRAWRRGRVRDAAPADLLVSAAVYASPDAVVEADEASARGSWWRVLALPLSLAIGVAAFTASATVIVQLLMLIVLPATGPLGQLMAPVWMINAGLMFLCFGAALMMSGDRWRRLQRRLTTTRAALMSAPELEQGDRLFEVLARLAPAAPSDAPWRFWRDERGWTLCGTLWGGERFALRSERSPEGEPRWSARLEAATRLAEALGPWWRGGGRVSARRLGATTRWGMDAAPMSAHGAVWADEVMEWFEACGAIVGASSSASRSATARQSPPGLRAAPPSSASVSPHAPTSAESVSQKALVLAVSALPVVRSPVARGPWVKAWWRVLVHWSAVSAALLAWGQVLAQLALLEQGALLAPMGVFGALSLLLLFVSDHPHRPLTSQRQPGRRAARRRSLLELRGDRLCQGEQRVVDLAEPFSVVLTQRGAADGRGALLGVELSQRPVGAHEAVRVRFAVPMSAQVWLKSLPRLDMHAPVIDSEDFFELVWPRICQRAAIHGVPTPQWSALSSSGLNVS